VATLSETDPEHLATSPERRFDYNALYSRETDTMKISRLLLLPVLGAALVAAGCGSSSPKVPADAVAVVGGTSITKASLDALLSRAKVSYKQQSRDFPKPGTSDYQALQQQAVTFLVKRQETQVEADALGVKVTDAQIDKRVGEIKKQYFGAEGPGSHRGVAADGASREPALRRPVHRGDEGRQGARRRGAEILR
jgi:hypothetical protein